MVLDDVADRPGLLVELPPAGHAEALGHGDLHARDVVAVPDWLEERVCEAEVKQVLHRLLAEVVIDPEDARLGEIGMQGAVEALRRGEITPEGFLENDASIF